MADAGDNSRALLTLRPDTAACQRRRQKWEVEFARYFVTPRRCPSTTPPPPGLRYLSRGKHRYHGTWIPAASPAALCLSRPSHPFAVPVLTVSIGDVVFEEHFVSILNFSWPQVACVTQCPVRGSRVVFVSFYDKSKQIQKFALRFPQLYDAESFLNCVQECSGDTMDIIPSGSDYVHEDSSASEYIASNGLQHKPDDASSFEEPTSDHRTEAPALCYREEPDQLVLEPLLATNIDNNHSGFPPSFTEILTNLSTKNEKDAEEPYPLTGTDHAPQEVYTLDTSHDVTVGSNETTAAKDIDATESTGDIMARIKTYMADNSFHGMSICSGSYFPSCGPCCCSKEKQLQICSVGDHLSIVRRFISILLSLSVLHLLYLPFVTPLCEELLFPPSAYKGLGTAISWGDLGSASAV